MKKSLFSLLFIFFSATISYSITVTNTGGGNWNAAIWTPSAPAAGDSVVIIAGTTVTVNVNTVVIKSINVLGTLNINNDNLSDLKLSDGLTIQNGAVVNNQGSIEHMNNGVNQYFNINGTGSYVHTPYNNVLLDESIFYNTLESFSNTCTLTINKWYDISIPVGSPSRVQISNFGNLVLNVNTTGLRWNQKAYFGPGRIKGTLTVSDGIVQMDDGQGSSTQLILQQVIISNTGSVIIRGGTSAPFTLTTNSWTDNSTSPNPTVLADTTFTLFTWNASGSVTLNHYFLGMVGTATDPGGDLRINITGNLSIGGTQTCHFITQCDAPLRLAVTGTTTISGTPTKVRFVDGNTGLLNFTTNDFVISGGADNVLFGGGTSVVPKATGQPTIAIANDFVISGASSTYIMNSDTNSLKLRLTVGRDFIMSNTGAQLIVANHLGANTFQTTRHFTMGGGTFLGEQDTLNVAIDSVIIGGSFNFNSSLATNYCIFNGAKGNTVIQTTGNFTVTASGNAVGQGVFGIYDGPGTLNFTVGGNYVQPVGTSVFNGICIMKPWIENGSLTFNVSGTFDQDGGTFRGIKNRQNSNASILTFTAGSIDYDGGNFSGYHAVNNIPGSNLTYNITNNLKVNFTATTDTFTFAGLPYYPPDNCFSSMNVNIGGSFILAGAAGHFISSYGTGGENYSITGGMTISGGLNNFNPKFPTVGTSHNVKVTMAGIMSVTGGTTVMCQYDDTLLMNLNSDFSMVGGTLSFKGNNGIGIINIKDAFSMTGGQLYLHNNSTLMTSEGTTVTVNSDADNNGNFTHTGGTITFDSNNLSNPSALPTIYIKSPTYTIGGTGVMTRNTGAAPQAFGSLRFSRNGTINFNRSGSHNIQQVQQYIESGTTVDVISGDVQIASGPNPNTWDLFTILSGARLALRTSQIKSNLILGNSGFTVIGTLAIQHPNGMYNGLSNAAVDATGGMNYLLQPSSTVEYYGTSNQIITGMNVGLATIGFVHKYYDLDINMGGTAWATPTNTPTINSVYVRHNLNLIAGELNMDIDHNPTTGGRNIIIEDSTVNAITQAAGFIRSETYDGSGLVRWNIGRSVGTHVFPFGYSAAPAEWVPYKFQVNSGDADTVSVATYHTNNPQNIPYPPTVTHLNNNAIGPNWMNTVDRFWYIGVTGTTNNANMTFTVISGGGNDELGGATISQLRAQRWRPSLISWEVAYQGVQTNPSSNSTLVTGASLFPNWWTLSGNGFPLPIDLLSFSGSCADKKAELKWVTATEINNDHFNVQRSIDGVNFETIGKVQGHGNSTGVNTYLYTDEYSLADMTYYKLEQVDYNGTTEEFGPVIVRNCQSQSVLDLVVTGQEAGNTNLLIQSPYSGKFNLIVLNVQGQVVINTDVNLSEGSNLVPLESDMLSTGIYHVRLQNDSDTVIKKVFINKN